MPFWEIRWLRAATLRGGGMRLPEVSPEPPFIHNSTISDWLIGVPLAGVFYRIWLWRHCSTEYYIAILYFHSGISLLSSPACYSSIIFFTCILDSFLYIYKMTFLYDVRRYLLCRLCRYVPGLWGVEPSVSDWGIPRVGLKKSALCHIRPDKTGKTWENMENGQWLHIYIADCSKGKVDFMPCLNMRGILQSAHQGLRHWCFYSHLLLLMIS